MTNNQLRNQANIEQARHNRVMESLSAADSDERKRSNLANESIKVTANDNTRRFNESLSAVNWFNARSNDSVNQARVRDVNSQIIHRRQQDVDNSNMTSAKIAQMRLQDRELIKESNRKDRYNKAQISKTKSEIDLNYKKGLNQTKSFVSGIMTLGVTAAPKPNPVWNLFK